MARIRTVKPELLKHEGLFDLELITGLPLRIAFVGLFTCCDRQGRFKWRPRTLKLDVLPHDSLDFSRVLDALATRDFIRKYVIDGEEYGVIPTFYKHQVINNRESESELPEPTESSYVSTTSTRESRVNDATPTPLDPAQAEGKGREGKGEEGKSLLSGGNEQFALVAAEPVKPQKRRQEDRVDDDFERAWQRYPKRHGGNSKMDALSAWSARIKDGHGVDEMIAGVDRYAAHMQLAGKVGTEFVMMAATFFGNKLKFKEDWPTTAPPGGRASNQQQTMNNLQDYLENNP